MARKPTSTRPVDGSSEDPRIAELAGAFASDKRVTAGKTFASYGLKVGGKIFAMIYRNSLVVRLPKGRVDELVAAGSAVHFDAGKDKPMKEWATIVDPRLSCSDLAREAFSFVSRLK
jgi:TfoX/Sxy family transcriptional regulator of competence genes